MKKMLLFLFVFTVTFGCQKEEPASDTDSSASSASAMAAKEDPLFAEKDEACDTEEDLEKKIEEAAKKKEGISLQGGDSGCAVSAE